MNIKGAVEKHPFYVKIAFIFSGLFIFFYTLWLAKSILIPIVYAIILAMLLNPIVNLLMRRKIPKILAIAIAVILAFLCFSALLYLIVLQSADFVELIPEIKVKFTELSTQFLQWFSFHTNIHITELENWILEARNNKLGSFASGRNITLISQFTLTMFLLPVYLCMILYYKPLFVEFIRRLFEIKHHVAFLNKYNSYDSFKEFKNSNKL